jgi:arylsulfatase A-like enzyme
MFSLMSLNGPEQARGDPIPGTAAKSRIPELAAQWLGVGLLAGLAAGLARGLWAVHAHRHLEHGTLWLAARELLRSSFETALGVGLIVGSFSLGMLLLKRRARTEPTPDPPGRNPLAIGLPLAGAVLFVLAGGLTAVLPYLDRARVRGRPSVILISIDTMRGDRLGVLGYDRPVTPHFDRLAREGVVFEQATSAAPWTLPSHVSIFTSLLPFDHRVRHVGDRIPPGLFLLAERFEDAGYRTGAFTGGGYVSWGYGFDQGFEVYHEHDEKADGGPGVLAARALEWIRSLDGTPFFAFVHTYEPHHPYAHDQFADPGDAGRLDVGYMDAEPPLTGPERRYATALYDSDIAHADRVIGQMLDELRADGILDDAIVVLLSDHGEDCWDHAADGIPRHGHTLYQELLHVPLIVRAPGIIPEGTRIETPVSLLDVAPTVLELAGLEAVAQLAGQSLAESCRTGREPEMVPIFSESTRYGPDRFALRVGDLKIVVTPHPEIIHEETYLEVEPLEVFDLWMDPDEQVGSLLRPSADPFVEQLTTRALTRLAEDRGPVGDHPEELLEQLRSLGYVEDGPDGAASDDVTDPRQSHGGPDPSDNN